MECCYSQVAPPELLYFFKGTFFTNRSLLRSFCIFSTEHFLQTGRFSGAFVFFQRNIFYKQAASLELLYFFNETFFTSRPLLRNFCIFSTKHFLQAGHSSGAFVFFQRNIFYKPVGSPEPLYSFSTKFFYKRDARGQENGLMFCFGEGL
jgi:hypothetical protein